MHRNVWISNATKMGSTVISLVAGQHLVHIQTYGECTYRQGLSTDSRHVNRHTRSTVPGDVPRTTAVAEPNTEKLQLGAVEYGKKQNTVKEPHIRRRSTQRRIGQRAAGVLGRCEVRWCGGGVADIERSTVIPSFPITVGFFPRLDIAF